MPSCKTPFFTPVPRALQCVQNRPMKTSVPFEGIRRFTPRCPRNGTAGRNCSAKEWCRITIKTSGSKTRIARFHNVTVPRNLAMGAARAPAAICRKVIQCQIDGEKICQIGNLGGWATNCEVSLYLTTVNTESINPFNSDYRETIGNLGSQRTGPPSMAFVDIIKQLPAFD